MTGRINSFQSLGTVDGPGVRCVVFMQGCPLRCVCCHNPETWELNTGDEVETDFLLQKILRFKNYFGQNGGVTVSGGEPLLQADFVTELFTELKKHGIHTALDTSGCIFNEKVEKLLSVTDLVLLDFKYSDNDGYLKNTGCPLKNVEEFLGELEKRNIPTWLRRVIIPGLNDDVISAQKLKETANSFRCVKKTELLPFRKLCIEKYKNLGIEFPLLNTPEPDENTMKHLNSIIDISIAF